MDKELATVSEYDGPLDGAKMSSKLPLSDQEKAIASLHDELGELERRLSAVLGPASESVRADDDPEPDMSPLALQLHANNRGIRRASYRLRDLMERLEC